MSRFDNRPKEVFKKDIRFGTLLEKFFFDEWVKHCHSREDIVLSKTQDSGVDNRGKFIKKGKTAGADYMVDLKYLGRSLKDYPLEVKWVPTPGKFSLKEGDLKAYIREGAGILFIYNTVRGTSLKKPKDYNLKKHIKKIQSKWDDIYWGIMFSENVKKLLATYQERDLIKPIMYMGNKPGLILKAKDYDRWFKQERLCSP